MNRPLFLVGKMKGLRLCLVRCKLFFECKIISVESILRKGKYFQMFVLGSRKYTGKVFSVFGRACKSIFPENILLRLGPQSKTFKENAKKIYL